MGINIVITDIKKFAMSSAAVHKGKPGPVVNKAINNRLIGYSTWAEELPSPSYSDCDL